jgi:hypothetical protein
MNIYTSDFHTLSLPEGSLIARMAVHPATERLTREDFKQDLLAMCQAMEGHTMEGILGDNRQQRFTIDLETQQWLGRVIYGKFIALGIRKMAMLMPQEFMAQLSVEQTFDEIRGQNGELLMQLALFDDEAEAQAWLVSKQNSPQEA